MDTPKKEWYVCKRVHSRFEFRLSIKTKMKFGSFEFLAASDPWVYNENIFWAKFLTVCLFFCFSFGFKQHFIVLNEKKYNTIKKWFVNWKKKQMGKFLNDLFIVQSLAAKNSNVLSFNIWSLWSQSSLWWSQTFREAIKSRNVAKSMSNVSRILRK